MPGFLANENISRRTVEMLRAHGHDVRWVPEDLPSIKDELVLMQASAEQRIVITFDSDYGELIYHKNFSRPLGVIFLRLHSTDKAEAATIILKFLSVSEDIFNNKFSVITSEGNLRYKAL